MDVDKFYNWYQSQGEARAEMEDNEVDIIINEFHEIFSLVENEVVPAKSRRSCHVHWWDGWENKPEDEPQDFKALKSELNAIIEHTGNDDARS